MSITHTKTQNMPNFNACGKLTVIAEIPVIPYCRDTFMTSKSIKHGKKWDMTSFPPMFLERKHTSTFMPIRKEILIHQSLCLKRSLELKSFLASH
jgi:hypothetical protein